MDIQVLNQKSLSIIFTSSANKYILKLIRFLVNFVRPFFLKKEVIDSNDLCVYCAWQDMPCAIKTYSEESELISVEEIIKT